MLSVSVPGEPGAGDDFALVTAAGAEGIAAGGGKEGEGEFDLEAGPTAIGGAGIAAEIVSGLLVLCVQNSREHAGLE